MNHGQIEREATDEPLSHRVILEVASVTGREPLELSPPLGAVVDTDALDALDPGGESGGVQSLSFEYVGRTVTIGNDGTVHVRDETDPSTDAATNIYSE